MTSISSYQLYKCSGCGQKHILPIYGTINFMHSPPHLPKPEDTRVCQRCEKVGLLSTFIKLEVIAKPSIDTRPKWLKSIQRLLYKEYEEPKLHPMQIYPELRAEVFDANTYFDELIRGYYEKNRYPLWFKELIRSKKCISPP